MEKIEANYSSFSAADNDEKGCEKLAFECADEITGSMQGTSVKGNWSEQDKRKMNIAIAEVEKDLESLGADKEAFIACYTAKLEAKYSSFYEADQDIKGCTKLSKKYVKSLGRK